MRLGVLVSVNLKRLSCAVVWKKKAGRSNLDLRDFRLIREYSRIPYMYWRLHCNNKKKERSTPLCKGAQDLRDSNSFE